MIKWATTDQSKLPRQLAHISGLHKCHLVEGTGKIKFLYLWAFAHQIQPECSFSDTVVTDMSGIVCSGVQTLLPSYEAIIHQHYRAANQDVLEIIFIICFIVLRAVYLVFSTNCLSSAPRHTQASSLRPMTLTIWLWMQYAGILSIQRSLSRAALTGPSRSGTTQ